MLNFVDRFVKIVVRKICCQNFVKSDALEDDFPEGTDTAPVLSAGIRESQGVDQTDIELIWTRLIDLEPRDGVEAPSNGSHRDNQRSMIQSLYIDIDSFLSDGEQRKVRELLYE